MKKIKFVLLFLILLLIPTSIKADNVVNIHLFYGNGCPHCAEEEEFLDDYLKDEENVKLYKYEVWYDSDNQKLLSKVKDTLNNKANGVPFMVIGDKVIVGYRAQYTDETIKEYVDYYKTSDDYNDVVLKLVNGEEVTIIKPTEEPKKEESNEFDVPILGKVNGKKISLPLLAVVLGLVDGFNPCAMWILIFLITMLLNMKNRKRMWILGITFILTSGLVYLAFMMSWLNLATFISKFTFIRILIALIAFLVGFINLNNYYKAKKKADGCEVVDKKDRKKIMTQIMNITSEKKFIVALGGIIILAASVNIIEMMCSIGLPLMFTQILAMNNLSFGSYMLYMIMYILFFLLDDIVVFVISMISLKVTGISTKYSKYSHLIAGILLVLIGLLLLIKPSILMFNF